MFKGMVMEEIKVVFLDVGQGDSTVIILPDTYSAVVVDCPQKEITLNYLEQMRISSIHLFITHTDLDHMGGAATLVENSKQVETLAYNHDTFLISEDRSKRRTILKHFVRLLDKHEEIQTYSPHTGQTWTIQDVEIVALHPSDGDLKKTVPRGDTNNASIVLRISFAKRRVLLTADIGELGWQWIMKRNTDIKADILKFPHHGAWFDAKDERYTLEKILEQINPSLAVLSVGTSNTYDHPKFETFKLLRLLRTNAKLRFLCTEATEKCYSLIKSLPQTAFPCAGTVEIVIRKDGITVDPDLARHLVTINTFDSAQCK
jgi:beta-lactamase superfamily II metal-dependent hydrolase